MGAQTGVYALPLDGGPARRLTDGDTVHITGELSPLGDDAVLVARTVRGRSELLRVSRDGDVAAWESPASITAAAEIPDACGDLVATVTDWNTAGEVVVLAEAGDRCPTWFGRAIQQAGLRRPQELTATASDGYPVHGWVVTPDGPGPHPVLLVIHGGPHHHVGPDLHDEFQVYAAAGYAVVACNPRGSAGYGADHARAITGDFGTRDMGDVLAFLDHAVTRVDGLDGTRVGIMGGSYGGYLTAWIIAHDQRFAAAIVERGYLDPASFVGSSDIGWYFVEQYNGTDPDRLAAQSPLLRADAVSTPTLVIHSERDLRCPLDQALRYYTRLKLNGVDTELLVFPGENHELTRSGRPRHRVQRFEAILDWWARHLPTE